MKNKNIVLRHIRESDIADYERWLTTETEWCDWDAPWEEDDPNEFLEMQKAYLKVTRGIYGKLEIDTIAGSHIGWVSSYRIDGNKEKIAVGINIPPVDVRGKGFGENALTLFMKYLFSARNNMKTLYTQTWSGNIAMIRLAEKIGFSVVERIEGIREVRGKNYDALTFSISDKVFLSKYKDIRIKEKS